MFAYVADDFPQLTDREAEILELVAGRRRDADIVAELYLSQKTVRNYVSAISPGSRWPTARRPASSRVPRARRRRADCGRVTIGRPAALYVVRTETRLSHSRRTT